MNNIPVYRAKKIDRDEYVEGYLINGRFIFKEWINDIWTCYGETRSNKALVYEIDPTTLAIHFPKDMIDSKGNKLFASLLNDVKNDKSTGTGGSIIKGEEFIDVWDTILTGEEFIDVLVFYRNRVTLMNQPNVSVFHYYRSEEIGIQQ